MDSWSLEFPYLIPNDVLRSRLEQLEQEQRLLKRKLIPKKLAALMSSTVNVVPNKDSEKLLDVNQIKSTISPCLNIVAEENFKRNLTSAYRFAGVTWIPYMEEWKLLRVDTYYNKRFYEPYFILFFSKENAMEVVNHNVPSFISIDNMAEQTLPNDLGLFTRAMNELLTAYVSRREQLNELKNSVSETSVKISKVNESFTFMCISVSYPSKPRYTITLTYDNWASIYPTNVEIEKRDMHADRMYYGEEGLPTFWTDLVTAYKSNTLLKAHKTFY